jgi:hypothetical protein
MNQARHLALMPKALIHHNDVADQRLYCWVWQRVM